ncbi:MAG: AAA family ATPase [Desulfoplanes sp.]
MTSRHLKIFAEINSPDVENELDMLFSTSNPVSIQKMPDTKDIDLLIHELSNDPDKDFSHIQNILNAENSPVVFVISNHTDANLILKAMQIGVKNFFPLPLEQDRFKSALTQIHSRTGNALPNTEIRQGQIIDVIGSKGGVGTTTIAVNLAVDLARLKESGSVALIDMNPLYGEVPLFLDIQSSYNWGELARNIDRVDATYLKKALFKHESGLHVLLSPGQINGQPADLDKIIARLLTLMRQQFDFIVIDSGQSLDQTALQTIHMSNKILLVTILSLPCLSNTNKLLVSLEEMGMFDRKNFQVIINRFIKNSTISLKDAEKSIHKQVYWTIPNDFKVSMTSINLGKPLTETKPRSKIAKRMQELAATIIAEHHA